MGIKAKSTRYEEMYPFPASGNGKVMCSLASSLAMYLYPILRESVQGRKNIQWGK